MTYNTQGIILSYRDIGEYDRIYSVLTRDFGKVDAWAQGVRKPKSKLCGHLQPLYFCDFMFARGRRFDRIAQVRVVNYYLEIRNDLKKLGQAMYAVSLVDMVLRPGTKEGGVFELMMSFFGILNPTHPPSPPSSPPHPPLSLRERALGEGKVGGKEGGVITLFSLKLLKESGFTPELRNCVLCKALAEGLTRQLDAIRGGVLCPECFKKAGSEAFSVSSLTLETLELILAAPLSHFEMPDAVRRELDQIADAMIQAHFGERPKSRIFMEALTSVA